MTPVYAVIPSAVVLGPLAVLAALFPGVAAVLSIVLKRWRAFLTVVGINSTLVALVALWRPGWGTTIGYVQFLVSILGILWAGVRYRRAVNREPRVADPPSRKSLLTLTAVATLAWLLVIGFASYYGRRLFESPTGSLLAAAAAGLIAATIYVAYRRLISTGSTSLSEEFVALLAMLVVSLGLHIRGDFRPPVRDVPPVDSRESIDGPRLLSARVLFRTAEMDEVMSASVIDGSRVYFGTGKLTALGSFGAVYAIDVETGAVVWRFDANEKLMPAYATPTVAMGHVYCGEGLHSDAGCSLYALKADSGQHVWSVPTASHTEGTPAVSGNRVYFSAGDDGLYCVDAGKPIWHHEGTKHRLHVDTSPVIAHGRVYAGSGYHTWAVFALEANTGDELWRVPETLRSFGAPLVLGSRVAFGLGTGNLTDDLIREPEIDDPPEREPAGAVLCVDGATGKVAWRTTMPRSVHSPMAADAYRVYAACRDGCVYALDRTTGEVRWRRPLGTALVAGPVLVSAFAGGAPLALYTVTEEGLAACLDPHTGRVVWTKDLSVVAGGRVRVLSSPAVAPIDKEGARRMILIGGSVTNRVTGRIEAVVFRLDDAVPADQ